MVVERKGQEVENNFKVRFICVSLLFAEFPFEMFSSCQAVTRPNLPRFLESGTRCSSKKEL